MTIKKSWEKLRTQPKTTMIAYYRYGLLSVLSGLEIKNTSYKFKCLACECKFRNMLDARTHPCSNEEDFRRITGRYQGTKTAGLLGLFTAKLEENNNNVKEEDSNNSDKSLVIDPEQWVKWNYELLATVKDQKEKIKSLSLDLEKSKKTVETLNIQLNNIRVVKLQNDQARALQEYNSR